MSLDIKIANSMMQFIDSNYVVDNPTQGWDCLNFIMTFYSDLGVEMPREFEDWTLENYGRRVAENPDKAHKTFERFVTTLGEEVNPAYMGRGDLLLFRVKDLGVYAGVFLGEGKVFMMFDKGGRVCPLAVFRSFVVSVRRLIK